VDEPVPLTVDVTVLDCDVVTLDDSEVVALLETLVVALEVSVLDCDVVGEVDALLVALDV
jgi:uncharacterized membrane protein